MNHDKMSVDCHYRGQCCCFCDNPYWSRRARSKRRMSAEKWNGNFAHKGRFNRQSVRYMEPASHDILPVWYAF